MALAKAMRSSKRRLQRSPVRTPVPILNLEPLDLMFIEGLFQRRAAGFNKYAAKLVTVHGDAPTTRAFRRNLMKVEAWCATCTLRTPGQRNTLLSGRRNSYAVHAAAM